MNPKAFVSNDWIGDPIAEALSGDGWEILRGDRSDGKTPITIVPSDYGQFFEEVELIIVSPPLTICDRSIIEAAPRLKAIFSTIIGVETIDMEAASEADIVVGIGATPENVLGCSEATVVLIGALSLDLLGKMAILRENKPRPSSLPARLVKKKTIGLIGCGRIGSGVAERLQGWDVHVIAHDPDAEKLPDNVTAVAFNELLSVSDVVSLHLPLTPETRGLIGEQEIASMKNGAFLINLARGGIVDEAALANALQSGKLAGAAVDCFESEPLPRDSRLRDLPNVILTPHMVGHTQDALGSLAPCAVESARRLRRGEPPLYVKNVEVLSRWQDRIKGLNERAA